jgi:hypothetical protein
MDDWKVMLLVFGGFVTVLAVCVALIASKIFGAHAERPEPLNARHHCGRGFKSPIRAAPSERCVRSQTTAPELTRRQPPEKVRAREDPKLLSPGGQPSTSPGARS